MGKGLIKGLASLCACALLVQMAPAGAAASEEAAVPAANTTGGMAEEAAPHIIGEVEGARDAHTKHFRLSDGTYVASEYPMPVHFRDDAGAWEEYDNTLEAVYPEAYTPDDAQEYANRSSDVEVRLAKKAKKTKMFRLRDGDRELSWGYVGASRQSRMELVAAAEAEDGDSRWLSAAKVTQEAWYRDLYACVDLQALVTPLGVKENLILREAGARREFELTYKTEGLTPVQADARTIELRDGDTAVYTLCAPLMTDAADAYSEGLTLTLGDVKNKSFTVRLAADNAWLDDPDRVYPVTLDPYLFTKREKSTSKNATMYQNLSGGYPGGTIYVGWSSAYGRMETVVQADMPSLGAGNTVIKAELWGYQSAYSSYANMADTQINVSMVTSNWSESALKVANPSKPSRSSTVEDYQIANNGTSHSLSSPSASPSASDFTKWDVTRAVKSWYAGTAPNYGIYLWPQNPDNKAYAKYVSAGSPTYPQCYPRFLIYYVNNNGLEEYWSYHSKSVSNGGTAYVNDYTGNLVLTQEVLSTTGSRAPVGVQLVYNGNNYNQRFKNSYQGNGWQFNFNMRFDEVTDSGLRAAGYHYLLTDADGTQHYFRQKASGNNVNYVDEDGLGLDLSVASNGMTLYDKAGTRWHFYSAANGGLGNLYSVTDSDGNYQRYYSDGVNGTSVITRITDGAGRDITITYGSVGGIYHPTAVRGPDGYTVQLKYEDADKNRLTKVEFPDGRYTQYTYDGSGRVFHVLPRAGGGVHTIFEYANGRVARIRESSGYDPNEPVWLSISYGTGNTTSFTDYRNVTETYSFNNAGQAVNVWHADGSVTSAKYQTATGNALTDSKKAHKLTHDNGTFSCVRNYAPDPNVERVGSYSVSTHDTTGRATASYDTSTAYLGRTSLKISIPAGLSTFHSYASTITAPEMAGKSIALSAYVKTSGVTALRDGYGAFVYMEYADANGTYLGCQASNMRIAGTSDWQRISASCTLPTNMKYITIFVCMQFATGTAWFDGIQLEPGDGPSDLNLLEDCRFNRTDRWTGSNLDSGDRYTGNGSVTIYGKAGVNKSVRQTVAVNKANVSLKVAAMGQASSVPLHDPRYFDIDVRFEYADGQHEYQLVRFNADTTAGQQIGGVVVPKRKNVVIASVTYFLLYYRNQNSCRFDFAMLSIDESGTAYGYDGNGNLQSAADNAQRNQAYTFSGANELTAQTDEKNESYQYAYHDSLTPGGNAHRLISARSQQKGNGFYYHYDEAGNVTTARMGTISSDGKSISGMQMRTQRTYNGARNYVTGEWDTAERGTTYTVNDQNGLVSKATAPVTVNGAAATASVNYTYDPKNYNLTKVSASGSAGTVETGYTYNGNSTWRLDGITHNGFRYAFGYDEWERRTSTKIGSWQLATNSYLREGPSSPVKRMTYGNGDYVDYNYNWLDQLGSVSAETGRLATYYYTYDRKLTRVMDDASGRTTEYAYDLLGRVTNSYVTGSAAYTNQYTYDRSNRLTSSTSIVNGANLGNAYTYGSDSLLTRTVYSGKTTANYTYDSLNRLYYKSVGVSGNPTVQTGYQYANVNGYSTERVGQVTYYTGADTEYALTYGYDAGGNIGEIRRDGVVKNRYGYDALGQLVREDNADKNRTTVYSYDKGGNLTRVTEYPYTTGTPGTATRTNTYTYGSTEWFDLLTGYNGQTFSFDAIGNPLTYRDGMKMTWERGRQLTTLQKGNTAVSYEYDSGGARVSKTVGGVKTTYYYNDQGQLVAQVSPGKTLWIYYSADGSPEMITYNGTNYILRVDAQGNVVNITNQAGTRIVEYTYDAWGNPVRVHDPLTGNAITDPAHIGNVNPFRYRSYYFDTESGFYFLQSRYYDPVTGRFINADGILGANGDMSAYNLFAYCGNNPVMRVDQSGYFWKEIGDWFKNLGNSIGKFFSDNFAAQSITTVAKKEDKKELDLFFAKGSINRSTAIEYESNTAKTVSAYVHQTDKRAGVKIKAGDLGSNLSIGKEGLSISGNFKNNNIVYSSKYAERVFAFDYTFSITQGKNTTSYSITVNKLNIALAFLGPGYALSGIGGKAIEVFA